MLTKIKLTNGDSTQTPGVNSYQPSGQSSASSSRSPAEPGKTSGASAPSSGQSCYSFRSKALCCLAACCSDPSCHRCHCHFPGAAAPEHLLGNRCARQAMVGGAHFCRVCIGAVVFCGVEVSLLLPGAWVPRWVLHLSSGATYSRPLRRYPQMRSLLILSGRSGPESKLEATRAFARALPPPHFLPPRTSHPPGPRLAVPATSPQSQQHRPFLPPPRGRRRFLFLPWLGQRWPLFCPVSWAGLPIPTPKEPGESAPSPAAPSASFFPPPTALQDEK